jgi:hypothetical protein
MNDGLRTVTNKTEKMTCEAGYTQFYGGVWFHQDVDNELDFVVQKDGNVGIYHRFGGGQDQLCFGALKDHETKLKDYEARLKKLEGK